MRGADAAATDSAERHRATPARMSGESGDPASSAVLAGAKIAVVGNMNNAGFTMMRYFRDIGADAHLLLWANDGVRSAAHFAPEADTWEMERWQPYVRRTDLVDWTTSVVPDVIRLTLPPSPAHLRRQLSGFDHYIGSGAAPAIFERAGLQLDVFWPYAMGVEWLDADDFRRMREAGPFDRPWLRGFLNRPFFNRMRQYQARGIRRSRYCFNAEMGPTASALSRLGQTSVPLPLPAVYNGRETMARARLASAITRYESVLDASTFKIFCAARWLWDSEGVLSIEDRDRKTKNSDMILHGLKAFTQRFPQVQVRLFTFEYGNSVEASRHLARSLGLSDVVVWLPTMERRQLRLLLSRCDVAIGEFYIDPGVMWGSTGWEALAAGKALIHSFNFESETFERTFGHPPPPILDAKSPSQIADRLCALYVDPLERRRIGHASGTWFDSHNGETLARRWLEQIAA